MSVTIIDKTKPLPPILVHKPKPLFRTTLERQKYWAKQREYWVEGYNGLPGMFYYHVQECFIKHRIGGNTTRAFGRDPDLILAERCHKAVKDGRPLGVLKGRGLGLSSWGGSMTNYFGRCYPGSTSLITGKEQSQISMLFSDKIMPVFNNLDPDIVGTVINKNETKAMSYLKAGYSFREPDGSVGYAESQVFCKETSEKVSSPSGFSGMGGKFGFYDEWPLHKRREALLKSSINCYLDPKTKKLDGLLLLGGTVEETLTNQELSDFQKTIKDSELWNIDLLFMPFWLSMTDENGHADEKKGMEWWEKEAERLAKMHDDSALRAHKMNNPRSLDDIFDLAGGARFEQDVADKIRAQQKIVIASNIPITTCRIAELNGRVETVVDKKGKVEILENPKQGIEYYLLIDGIATGKKAGEDEGSSVAGTIIKTFDPDGTGFSPVSIYCERPDSIEQAYITLVNQAKYYNKFSGLKGVMAEANAGTADHFSTFLEKNGMGRFIMKRKDLSGKGYSNTNKLFQYVTDSVRDFQMRQCNTYLRKYCGNIKMLSLLNDMMKPIGENADILDSFLMMFVALPPDYDKPISKKVVKKRIITVVERNSRGEMVWVDKEIKL